MSADRERCSDDARTLGEALAGTASTVANWMLLEQPGPWGSDALRTSRLPPAVAEPLRARAAAAGVRVILIRRAGRHGGGEGRRCFLVHTGPDAAWAERRDLGGPAEALDADLEALGRGEPPGFGEPEPGPVYVVCTHGRRDPCCAERGRPLAAALARTRPDAVWESSHVGGDRFAGNLLCFPHGLYFGHVEPAEAAAIADAYEAGRVPLERYRGRSCYGFAVQFAEADIRRREAIVGVDDLRLEGARRTGDVVTARFGATDGRRFEVSVRTFHADPRRLTCQAPEPLRPHAFEVLGVTD